MPANLPQTFYGIIKSFQVSFFQIASCYNRKQSNLLVSVQFPKLARVAAKVFTFDEAQELRLLQDEDQGLAHISSLVQKSYRVFLDNHRVARLTILAI